MTASHRSNGLRANIESFHTTYPTPEKRLKVAQDMATGGLGDSELVGRGTMAAHWGHNDRQFEDLAEYLDSIKFGADEFCGQAALIFNVGSPDAALATPGMVGERISAVFGRMIVGTRETNAGQRRITDIHHGYASDKDDESRGIKPRIKTRPYLVVGVGLELQSRQVLKADMISARLLTRPAQPAVVNTYLAVIPTDGSTEIYARQRSEVRRPFIFGNDKVREFLAGIRDRTKVSDDDDDVVEMLMPARKPVAALPSTS